MLVMVGMERSGTVREAFRMLGHTAYSCDLVPADDGSEYHIIGDALEVVQALEPDLAIFHPPCTYLSLSGYNLCFQPQERYPNSLVGEARIAAMHEAARLFMDCYHCGAKHVAVENPVGRMTGLWRAADQYVEPWMFGHGELKKTGLWLKGLPKLVPTNVVPGREQKVWKMSPGPERSRLRAITYPGIAAAMADQWGRYVESRI